jgi:hypothetical protein
MPAGQSSKDAHHTQIESDATLSDIESVALGITLKCLGNLDDETPVFDQRARSAEALMRIALHAMAAQRQNQKDVRADAERAIAAESGDAKTEISDEQTRKLANKLTSEIIRLTDSDKTQPKDNRKPDCERGAA